MSLDARVAESARFAESRLAESAGRIVERSLTIVQEEFELARIELVEKLPLLGRELVMMIVAAMLVAVSGVLATFGLVWLLARYVFGFDNVWASFLLLAVLVLVPAFLLGRGALRRARAVGPPVPTAAIRQAKLLRKAVTR